MMLNFLSGEHRPQTKLQNVVFDDTYFPAHREELGRLPLVSCGSKYKSPESDPETPSISVGGYGASLLPIQDYNARKSSA